MRDIGWSRQPRTLFHLEDCALIMSYEDEGYHQLFVPQDTSLCLQTIFPTHLLSLNLFSASVIFVELHASGVVGKR
jgi:hypothetical protein